MATIAQHCRALSTLTTGFPSTDPEYDEIKFHRGKVIGAKSGTPLEVFLPTEYIPVSADNKANAIRSLRLGDSARNELLSENIHKWIFTRGEITYLMEQSANTPEVFYLILVETTPHLRVRNIQVMDTRKSSPVMREVWGIASVYNTVIDAVVLSHQMWMNRDKPYCRVYRDPIGRDDATFENFFRGEFSAAPSLRQLVAVWLAGAPGGFIVTEPKSPGEVFLGQMVVKKICPRGEHCPDVAAAWQQIATSYEHVHVDLRTEAFHLARDVIMYTYAKARREQPAAINLIGECLWHFDAVTSANAPTGDVLSDIQAICETNIAAASNNVVGAEIPSEKKYGSILDQLQMAEKVCSEAETHASAN